MQEGLQGKVVPVSPGERAMRWGGEGKGTDNGVSPGLSLLRLLGLSPAGAGPRGYLSTSCLSCSGWSVLLGALTTRRF